MYTMFKAINPNTIALGTFLFDAMYFSIKNEINGLDTQNWRQMGNHNLL